MKTINTVFELSDNNLLTTMSEEFTDYDEFTDFDNVLMSIDDLLSDSL